MQFEFDPAKSEANQKKHGISFETALALWNGKLVVLDSKKKGEPRKLAVGRIGMRLWTAIFTERGYAIRLISVRRSRDEEKQLFYKNYLEES